MNYAFFAQRKVFVLKSKRLWLLVAIALGPKQWAHLSDMLCQEHPSSLLGSLLLLSNKQIIQYLLLKAYLDQPLTSKKCELDHPPPHSSKTPSLSAFPPSIPTPLHITALIMLYDNCLVTCLSFS